jgi:antitoxin VapB
MGMDTAKLFQNGRSQAVRLPKEYRFPGSQVYLRKMGKGVLLMPEEDSWEMFIQSTQEFTEDFLEVRDQGEQENRDSFSQ